MLVSTILMSFICCVVDFCLNGLGVFNIEGFYEEVCLFFYFFYKFCLL